jgi:hypothetical protein
MGSRRKHLACAIGLVLVVTCSETNAPEHRIVGTFDVTMQLTSLYRFNVCSDPSHGLYCDTTEAVSSSDASAVLTVHKAKADGGGAVLTDVDASVAGTACGTTANTCYTGTSGYTLDTTWMDLPTPQLAASGTVNIGLTRSTATSSGWPEAFKLQGVFAGDSIQGSVEWEPSSYIHGFAVFRGTFVAHKR